MNTYSRIQRLLSEEDFNVFQSFTKNLEDFVDDKITASALWECTYKMLDNHKDVWKVLRLKSLYNEFMEFYENIDLYEEDSDQRKSYGYLDSKEVIPSARNFLSALHKFEVQE